MQTSKNKRKGSDGQGLNLEDLYSKVNTNANDISTNRAQLEKSTSNEILDNQFSRKTTYDYVSTKPSTYEAIINNPSGVNYTNKPVGIYMSFKKGECINDKRLTVFDETATEIPSQWEDDIHSRTYASLGKYDDGSLKNGTLWILINLNAGTQKKLSIKIAAADTNYTDNIPLTVVTAGQVEKLTAGQNEFTININASWGILKVVKSGVDLNGATALQATSITDSAYAAKNSSQTGLTSIISKVVNGNGVVFKEVVSKFSYVYNSNIVSTFRTKIWANGDADWLTRTETTATLSAGVLNCVMEKIQWAAISGATLQVHNHELYTAETGTSKILAGFRWHQRHGESYDANSYPLVTLNASTKAYVGWQNTSPATLAIPNGAYWTSSAYVSFDYDTVDNERLRRINRLYTRATNKNVRTLKRKFSALSKFYVENMRDYNLINGQDLFPGINGLESLGITCLNGENLYAHAIDRFNYSLIYYTNGTTAGFVNAWQTTDWRRGIQYIGRDMSILLYLYNEANKRNDTVLTTRIISIIHNLADAFVQIEGLSGGNGKVALRGDGTQATSSDCANSEAAAIRYINLSLKFAENQTRRDCMNRIIARFNSTMQYNTKLPYSLIEIDTYYDFLINPRLAYHSFAMYDYLQAVANPPFDIRQLAFETTNATGQVKEIGYEYQQERRGQASTTTYFACILYKAGNISDLEQACKLLEYVISFMYPSGGHIFPLDGYSNNDNVISGTPLESQALIETLFNA